MCVIFGAHVDERSPAYRAMDRYFWIGHLVANRLLWLRRLILWLASHGRLMVAPLSTLTKRMVARAVTPSRTSACSAYLGAAWSPRGLAAARKNGCVGHNSSLTGRVRDFLIAAIPEEIRLNAALSLAE
jgi:hypothetical protein